MIIHKAKSINSVIDLKVSIWKQTHDKKDIFYESYDGEHTIKEKTQTKYQGCIISNDGTNIVGIKLKWTSLLGQGK